MSKHIKSLDLVLQEELTRIISLDKATFNCHLRNGRAEKHLLHGEDFQANTIIDLIVELGQTYDREFEKLFKILELLAHSIGEKNRLLAKIEEKLDYLHKDNSSIHEKFSHMKISQLPKKQDLAKLSSLIEENKPKEI